MNTLKLRFNLIMLKLPFYSINTNLIYVELNVLLNQSLFD